MIASLFKKVFDPLIELDLRVWENFSDLGHLQTFPKESILKPANTTENYINFIVEGSGGNLLLAEPNPVCIDISLELEFLNDYMSFTTQQSSPIEVRLFEDSKIFRIPYQNFQQTMLPGNFGERISLLASQGAFIEKQQQQIDLLTKTAKMRYLELLDKKPELDRIPLKYLASYLGITPQSLSRIRAEKI